MGNGELDWELSKQPSAGDAVMVPGIFREDNRAIRAKQPQHLQGCSDFWYRRTFCGQP
jgi:hypothetical protein